MEVNTSSQQAALRAPPRSIHPPYLEALPSSSLSFPQFATEIAESDDRVLHISSILHRILTENRARHDSGKGTCIEIEGKLANFTFHDTPTAHQMREATQSKYWSLLKPM